MKKIFKYILMGVLPLTAFSCSSVDVDDVNTHSDLPNAIYMEGVLRSPAKRLTVDENGVETTFAARAANLVSKDIDVTFSVDTAILRKFNAEYGKNYKLLPAEFYTIERNSDVIKAGNFSTGPIKLTIKKETLEADPMTRFAIALKISSNSSMKLLEENSYQIFVIDRLFATTAMYQRGFYMRYLIDRTKDWSASPAYKEWTFHYGMKLDRLIDNQQPPCGRFYSRITSNGRLQYKAGGSDDPAAFSKQLLKTNTWYHITFVYKNQHVKMYINGLLESEFDVLNNDSWPRIQDSWGNFSGCMRDIRLYDCAQTPDQVMETLYVEDPTNPNLVVYAPLDKENRTKCVVSKFNDPDGKPVEFEVLTSGSNDPYDVNNIKWTSTIFFPEK